VYKRQHYLAFAPLLLLALAPLAAHAHLTWIEQGTSTLGLATGHHFPNKELSVSGDYVEYIRCTATSPEKPPEQNATALSIQNKALRFKPPFAPANCEAKLKPSSIALTPDEAYKHLRESRAPKVVFAAFENLGYWQEQFFKSAQMAPIALDSPLYQSEQVQFITKNSTVDYFNVTKEPLTNRKVYLYKQDQPVAKQAVGLDSPSLARTVWLQTQADGEVVIPFALKETAMLHAVLITPQGESFTTQFVTTLID
jgi:hypothetical protein